MKRIHLGGEKERYKTLKTKIADKINKKGKIHEETEEEKKQDSPYLNDENTEASREAVDAKRSLHLPVFTLNLVI